MTNGRSIDRSPTALLQTYCPAEVARMSRVIAASTSETKQAVSQLSLMVTRRCNMTCSHCSVKSSPGVKGEPSEAELLRWVREAAQAGESFVNQGMLNTRIGSDVATVIDDPTIENSYGFYLYDDEGVKARPKVNRIWMATSTGTMRNAGDAPTR